MGDDQIASALNLMRRLPPAKTETNLQGLLNLIPDATDELLQRVDQPLEVSACPTTGRKYLLCDYNRDGDSYRSPWSNMYDPPIDDGDGFVPSDELRKLEIMCNALFDAYRELYYDGGGVSSVYLWDLEGGFAGCFLIKKGVSGHEFVHEGSWDSIHVIQMNEQGGGKVSYKLTSTVMLNMDVKKDVLGDTNLCGSLTRQTEKNNCVLTEAKGHAQWMGELIENMEIDLRSNLDQLYIQKTREIVNTCRRPVGQGGNKQGNAFTADLAGAVMKHGANRKIDSA